LIIFWLGGQIENGKGSSNERGWKVKPYAITRRRPLATPLKSLWWIKPESSVGTLHDKRDIH
jgi:hypothetical protein